MSVVFEYLQSGGSGFQPVTRFSDTFNRPDEPTYLGNNYWPCWCATTNPGFDGATSALIVNVAGAQAVFAGGDGQPTARPLVQ